MTDLDTTCVNTLRFLAVDAVEKANSGHPGLPLDAAPMAYVLWTRFLRHDPSDPTWPDRDRFVLSAGHGSALLYALLHLSGYDLPIEELQRFRQWGSRTPGHPEYGRTPGVEATTGPLGQGFAMGVGMAIAERHLAAEFNREGLPIVDHRVWGIVSDGDLEEGIASEAASLAGTLGLGKLTYLYDDNHVSLEGPTEWAFTEDVAARFAAYGWHVLRVADGNDLHAIAAALEEARSQSARPTLICVRTHLGYGSPVQDTREAHGEPLGPKNLQATKEKLGWPLSPAFLVPEEARARFAEVARAGGERRAAWEELRRRYAVAHPADSQTFEHRLAGELPPGWESALPRFQPSDGPMATRDASQKVLNALAPKLSALVGGAADLSPSTKTVLAGAPDYSARDAAGRNFHFGVREHAMAGVVNGIALHGGLIPYGGTFLVFSDYARGGLRLAALQGVHAIFVFTHDSIGMGEDGPTHQPIEHLLSLRAIPEFTVFRPGDANEAVACWAAALRLAGPSALVFTRQKIPILDPARFPIAEGTPRGGYILSEATGGPPQLVLIATGSEVSLAVDAQAKLTGAGVRARVVSLPSWELFDAQPTAYRDEVLPPGTPKLSIEAGRSLGWERYLRGEGAAMGIDRFGASAPGPVVQRELGLTVDHVVAVAQSLLDRSAKAAG